MNNVLKEIEDYLKEGKEHRVEITIRSGCPTYIIHMTSLMESRRFEIPYDKIPISELYKAVRGL